jgi:C_GCAxxG_C_C family probable redox protein
MIYKGELRFNCCESTLMKINEVKSLPGFDKNVIRIASNMGGGVGGWGDMCGAASGVAMAIGLIYGTEGEETIKIYEEMRARQKALTLQFLQEFKTKWGNVTCRGLLGCEACSPEERFKRYNYLKERGETHCDEYVDWSAETALKIIN